MVLDLKFTRFENTPWGFRLTGGNDFELPLTVIKVREGSIAEEAGLKVGDVVVRINDTPTSNLSHSEAHEIIMECANTFFLGVLRPDEDGCYEEIPAEQNGEQTNEQTNGVNGTNGTHGTPSPYRQFQTPDSQAYSDMSEMTIHTNHTESVSEEVKSDEISDDHIAEMMSGEAEVLKEHNVIGVNFKRIIPKAGLFKSSEVFKHLNEEAMKTKADKDQETKKWTTFLQKPDRPIPKSKFDLEREHKISNGYKIVICKQPKPKCDPNRPPSPVPEIEPEPQPAEIELVPGPEPQYVEYLNEEIVDVEIPNADDQQQAEETEEQLQEEPQNEDVTSDEMIEPTEDTATIITPPKTEEEILIEKQLAEVQRQLLALSSLPSTIQATLDAVTKQLAELMPALKQTSQPVIDSNVDIENGSIGNSDVEVDTNDAQIDTQNDEVEPEPKDNESATDIVIEEIVDEKLSEHGENEEPAAESVEENPEATTQEVIEKQRMEKVFKKQEEEWLNKKEKIEKWNKIWSWTDEAKGSMYRIRESNCAFLEQKLHKLNEINFLKYKKPEKDLSNLNRSEVFRIIHNIEKDPKHGIQVRPSKVLAEEDVRNRATPIHCT